MRKLILDKPIISLNNYEFCNGMLGELFQIPVPSFIRQMKIILIFVCFKSWVPSIVPLFKQRIFDPGIIMGTALARLVFTLNIILHMVIFPWILYLLPLKMYVIVFIVHLHGWRFNIEVVNVILFWLIFICLLLGICLYQIVEFIGIGTEYAD